MTQHRLIWQAPDVHTFEVADERSDPFTVTANPVITNYWFGTTVGFYYRNANGFGHWYSSNICGLITAWRVAQILPLVKTLRNRGGGYDTTLCGLVIAMGADRHETRMRHRAEDLGMTVEELDALLLKTRELWPNAELLHAMWGRLPESEQDKIVGGVRKAITEGHVDAHTGLIQQVEQAELRLRTKEEQKQHEDELIDAGLEPSVSLKQLMVDIGVTNLAYTVGYGEMFDPTHFSFDDLDRAIMKELIGSSGFSRWVSLVTTLKQPDDPSAHHSAGGGGVTIYTTDFGDRGHPRVTLGGEMKELVCVRYDRVTERFQLALRPPGLERDQDEQDILMTIEELRKAIGADIGDGTRFLAPGQPAPWCAPVVTPATVTRRRRRRLGRGED
jgi:hypothetical protein